MLKRKQNEKLSSSSQSACSMCEEKIQLNERERRGATTARSKKNSKRTSARKGLVRLLWQCTRSTWNRPFMQTAKNHVKNPIKLSASITSSIAHPREAARKNIRPPHTVAAAVAPAAAHKKRAAPQKNASPHTGRRQTVTPCKRRRPRPAPPSLPPPPFTRTRRRTN